MADFKFYSEKVLNFRMSQKFYKCNHFVWYQKLARHLQFEPPTHYVGGDIDEI